MEKKIEKGKKKYKVKFTKIKNYFNIDDDKWNKMPDADKKAKIKEYNQLNNIKSHYFSFRINDNDYKLIKALIDKGNIKKSDILYYFLHNFTYNETEIIREEIKKQGININQMSKKCNQLNDKPEIDELKKINENLIKIYKKIKK